MKAIWGKDHLGEDVCQQQQDQQQEQEEEAEKPSEQENVQMRGKLESWEYWVVIGFVSSPCV